ncbi:hypothetical protein BO71DRAFT_197512 [Aspergillus ellipticus CBS 707.79]|uniref:Uncharacterized protein n=1 Tax=Aspergillus ellipticus CBS 707.79 TaxID=1448320 RepID=A0A319DED9_9EURO|nr:hypothetical protein BO71DRAFT_197512 [Aspergillus ellipticus CBS 707.79]
MQGCDAERTGRVFIYLLHLSVYLSLRRGVLFFPAFFLYWRSGFEDDEDEGLINRQTDRQISWVRTPSSGLFHS